MVSPGFDENLGFLEGVEDLPVQELVAQSGIETLDVAVLPGRSRLDEGSAGADRGDPPPDGLGDELRSVVGADVARNAAQEEQIGQHIDDVDRGELAPDPDGQPLAGELVQDVEHAEGSAAIGPVTSQLKDFGSTLQQERPTGVQGGEIDHRLLGCTAGGTTAQSASEGRCGGRR